MLVSLVTAVSTSVSNAYRKVAGPAHRYPYTDRKPQGNIAGLKHSLTLKLLFKAARRRYIMIEEGDGWYVCVSTRERVLLAEVELLDV